MSMKQYKIATMSEGYAFEWLNMNGKTGTIYTKGCLFTVEQLVQIIENNPHYLSRLDDNDRGFSITQIASNGNVIKQLNKDNFKLNISII